MKTLAQSLTVGGQTVNGPLTDSKFDSIAGLVNAILGVVYPLALFLLFIYLLWAGFDMASNLGNPKQVESGKTKITNALIGIVLLSLSYWGAQIAIKIFF